MTSLMTDEQLAEIEARVSAASHGPWHKTKGGMCIFQTYRVSPQFTDHGGMKMVDADFIIHARTDVPALLAAVRHLQAENERLESERAALCAVIGTCKAGRDGDCSWSQCPQTRDGGKHYQSYCPLARYWEAVWESQGYDIRCEQQYRGEVG